MSGTVTDELGGLVPNATIKLHSADGKELTTKTGAKGTYIFDDLKPGLYTLRVLAVGFSSFEERGVEVKLDLKNNYDVVLSIGLEKQDVTVKEEGVSTDSDRNANALILRQRDLQALPTDPRAFAEALRAMAGPQIGPNGPQVQVDGFSNGQIPPKEAIREIRFNQNPYSAENEYPGWGGIEIYTQPGADKFHGGAGFDFNDESLNSRGFYAPRRAPYQQRSLSLNLSGPLIRKRASFSFFLNRNANDSNSIVYATVLDPVLLTPSLFNQSILTPTGGLYTTSRVDLKINAKHTLVGSYQLNNGFQNLQGIGGFALPSRAFRGRTSGHILQLTETAVINEHVINETRLQLFRDRSRQQSLNDLPALNVLDSFFGGGAQTGLSINQQQRMELQNFTSWATGHHFVKIGWRLRGVKLDSTSPANFGGTYTFTGGTGPQLDAQGELLRGADGQLLMGEISSLERYRRTLFFQSRGLSAAEIRLRGGGATQFSIAGGNPNSGISQYDTGSYVQDDWKIKPNFTLSPGLRYENQTNIKSDFNFAPRIGFAWSPSWGSKKPKIQKGAAAQTQAAAVASPGGSKTVIRGGFGFFYNRISENLILQALRFNGQTQQQFVVSDPQILDLYPAIPSVLSLDAFRQPQTTNILAPNIQPIRMLQSSLSFERQLPRQLRLSVYYSNSISTNTTRMVNLNSPLAGTYTPEMPTSGVRPLGNERGNIYATESNGRSVRNQLSVSLNGNIKKIGFWGSYTLAKTNSTDDGTSGSPFDAYDFSHEWGRAAYDLRHFAYFGGYAQLPFGFSLNPFIIANSGAPFNITIGRDTNGDTFFNERPAFATDLRKPGVVVTPLGAFDPNPSPGQTIIPRNFGQAPGYMMVNIGLSKVFNFGRAIAPPASMSGAGASAPTVAQPSGSTKTKQPIQRPFHLNFSIYAANLFNHANEGPPIGNMASPYFLKSNGASGTFIFFGPGGTSGNRQITLGVRLNF